MKWREQVEGNTRSIGLRKEDPLDRCRWREGENASGHLHSLRLFKLD